MPNELERRKLQRLPLEVMLRIAMPGTSSIAFGETRNVSAQGIFFHTWARLEVGQDLDGLLVLPENLTLTDQPAFVGCKGRVVRLNEAAPDQMLGVAMEVYSFDFSAKPESLLLENTHPLSTSLQ